jgi:hypothetical protein
MTEVSATESMWLYSNGVCRVAECSDLQASYCGTVLVHKALRTGSHKEWVFSEFN